MAFDQALFQRYVDQVREGLAQMVGMVAVATSPTGGAIQPVAPQPSAPLTAFAPWPGDPLPDSDPIPDKSTLTLSEWLTFLDDHSLMMSPGELIGYIQYRGGYAPNVAFAMASQWGGKYPPALTHCQTLRAIQQSVPYDVPNLAHWDSASRTWLDATNHPYVAQTQWQSAVATGR